MSEREIIDMKEYTELLDKADREHTTLLIELIKTILEEHQKALALQHKEYERRLEALNGEAARIRSIQETYVPRETYEAFIKEQAVAAKLLSDRIEETRQRLETSTKETINRLEEDIAIIREVQGQNVSNYLGINRFEQTVAEWSEWRKKVDDSLAGDQGAARKSVDIRDFTSRVFSGFAVLISFSGLIYLIVH